MEQESTISDPSLDISYTRDGQDALTKLLETLGKAPSSVFTRPELKALLRSLQKEEALQTISDNNYMREETGQIFSKCQRMWKEESVEKRTRSSREKLSRSRTRIIRIIQASIESILELLADKLTGMDIAAILLQTSDKISSCRERIEQVLARKERSTTGKKKAKKTRVKSKEVKNKKKSKRAKTSSKKTKKRSKIKTKKTSPPKLDQCKVERKRRRKKKRKE